MPSDGSFSKSAISRAVGVVAVAGAASMGCEDGTAPPAEPATAPSALPNPALPGIERPDAILVARLAEELEKKGASYQPRAEHRVADGAPKFVNRLIAEQSPYLLQHAHNPVNWFAWGDEAFERARAEGKPVLLSIGYSTCHWCHVMERESFEDLEIATLLNQRFICIKVDREERPDVDSVYMTAVQMLTGRGGWPMTVVLTPDGEPFFAGTYFPARDGDRGSSKGFLTIASELSDRYGEDSAGVVATAQSLSQRIAASAERHPAGGVPGPELLSKAAVTLSRMHDETYGGFGGAPKFPTPVRLDFLLRYARRSGDGAARDMVLFTLDKMADGGIRDHVGGGFHRYATDRKWLVPHFEKMLYDNAQLAMLYLDAFQVSGESRYRDVATEILDYVAREMTDPKGGFYSATDADSLAPSGDLEEGLFFTWTPKELEAVLGAERAAEIAARYGVVDRGHLEGRSVLSVVAPIAALAKRFGVEEQALEASLAASRKRLYAARSKRRAPLCDDKIVTSYNGLMISAFARGAFTLDRPDYAERAARAAELILGELRRPDGRLLRSYREKPSRHDAFLDDYAFLIQGLLDLHEATGEPRWLTEALALHATLDEHYAAPDGGYFMTADDAEKLLRRERPDYDGAEPSGNAVALSNLLRLGVLTSAPRYRARAEALLRALGGRLQQNPVSMTRMLGGLDFLTDRPREVVLVRPGSPAPADEELEKRLVGVIRGAYLPNRAVLMTREGPEQAALAQISPLVEDKRALRDKTTAFVCTEGRCELPTSDPAVLATQLGNVEPLIKNSGAAPGGAPL